MVTDNRIPEISVIIPTYNRANDLGRCLDSLLAQTFREFEVLVCDDGSTDNTAEVVSSYSNRLDLRFFPGKNFGGPARARNTGILHAKADIIAFLDSDDWWAPDKLETCLPYFQRGADVVYHALYSVSDLRSKKYRVMDIRQVKQPVCDDLLRFGNTLPTSGTMVRTELLHKLEGFLENKDFIAWEDYDCWIRLARITDNFVCIPTPLGYYWSGGGNISTAHRILEYLEAMKRHYFPDKIPFWYYDRKALAWHMLGESFPAYKCKIKAFWLAPTMVYKWKITKVLVKWLLGLA